MGFFDNLPDNVLFHILSFLSTKDAARTSVLSPRWRYLFVSSISELDFKRCVMIFKKDDSFPNFVDRFFSSPKLLPCLEDLEFYMCRFRNISELNIHSLLLKRLHLGFGLLYADSRRGFNAINIDAPNLVYFQYANGMGEECTLSEMKSLERADIQITVMDNEDRERVANFLRGVCNVKSLYLGIEDSPRTFFLAPLDPMLAFHNLVELEFRNKFNDAWQGTWIVELLRCMPNLKTTSLELASKSGGFGPLPAIVPSCLLFRIKEI
ncbi:F-box/LRR-repeat protein At3g59210-like [Hibiscus syriacus]|uniref:F-box/LRR-repeat protein At3g59210-like n=1 Tax=Hibiscus syriacus TaxID=106335 RepID=UPI0019244D75|nr:F-box/LRR-repeat protein At3g59210-like [Hibiscus syriacus]